MANLRGARNAHLSLLVLLILSGCSTSTSTPPHQGLGTVNWQAAYHIEKPDPNLPVTAFEVNYTTGPYNVMAANGEYESVSRYSLTAHIRGAKAITVFDVDSSGRVLRHSAPCGLSDCSKSGFQWLEHRVPPPFGFSLPDYIQDSKLPFLQGIAGAMMEAHFKEGGARLTLTIEDPGWTFEEVNQIALGYLYPVGSFVYAKTDMRTPLEFTAVLNPGSNPVHAVRDSFTVVAASTVPGFGAHFVPHLPAPRDRAAGVLLMPDEDQRLPGSQTSVREALDYLLQAVPEAKAMLDAGGCISSLNVFPDRISSGSPAGLLDTRDSDFYFGFSDGVGAIKQWNVRHETNSLNQSTWSQQSSTPIAKARPCAEIKVNPIQISLSKLFPQAVNLTVSGSYVGAAVEMWSTPRSQADQWMESSARYEFSFKPAEVNCPANGGCFFRPHSLDFDARSGHLVSALVGQADYFRWGN